jgi:hypothetical protein
MTFSFLVSGCSFAETPPTPKQWGKGAGEYGSKQWLEEKGNGVFPSAEGIATYCVNISEDGLKNYDWTIAQAYESTQACTDAFSRGLGIKS